MTNAENGMLEPGELEDKFLRLTRGTLGEAAGAGLFERLQRLEEGQGPSLARRSAVGLAGALRYGEGRTGTHHAGSGAPPLGATEEGGRGSARPGTNLAAR